MNEEEPILKSAFDILKHPGLSIPYYQRPYKWTIKNVRSLLNDIEQAICDSKGYNDYKYRIGTVILHKDKDKLNIVDGQQRLITLALIYKAIKENHKDILFLNNEITSIESEKNIKNNFLTIKDFFYEKEDFKKAEAEFEEAFKNILEFVIITIKDVSEAFQLFDSQNTRGKELDPHDLLKAYHLRAMKNHPNEMKHVVELWEGDTQKMQKIRELFRDYLFPINNWIIKEKGHLFSSVDIDLYKGVAFDYDANYARRTVKAMPCYQIDQPFVEGKDFFGFVNNYLNILTDIEHEVKKMKLNLDYKYSSYSKQLFYCVVLLYYDRFKNFDNRVIKRLYAWAFIIRLKMQNLMFVTIKNYAIGESTNKMDKFLPLFFLISRCRNVNDVLEIRIPMVPKERNEYEYKEALEKEIISILGENK